MHDERETRGKLVVIRDYVTAMRARSAGLRERLFSSAGPSAAEAIQELETTQEELAVADEELWSQAAELERVRAKYAAELRYYRDLFDRAPDGYAETDPHGVIRDGNQT